MKELSLVMAHEHLCLLCHKLMYEIWYASIILIESGDVDECDIKLACTDTKLVHGEDTIVDHTTNQLLFVLPLLT